MSDGSDGAARDVQDGAARTRRTAATVQLVLAVLWIALAVSRWLDGDGDAVTRWLWTGLAIAYVVSVPLFVRILRRNRRAPGR